MHSMHLFFLFILLFLSSCSDNREPPKPPIQATGEYIYRLHNEVLYTAEAPKKIDPPTYPWDSVGKHPKITKEYFRCKGSCLNTVRTGKVKNETVQYFDCGGTERHSLPMRNNKEFVYPILINLLKYD